MAIGFAVKYYFYEIGTGDFLFSFFSTVAHNLEGRKWGSRFPVIMKAVYNGQAEVEMLDRAMEELSIIKKELKELPPDKVVWDIEDMSAQPPWGNDISDEITDLSNYFVTSEGEDFISVFMKALEDAKALNEPIRIEME